MEENEIYTRLGLENKEELMELLDLSDRVQKIKYFYPSIDIKTTQPVRLALRNGNFFEITGMDNNRIQRLKCSREGWETVLRLNNNSNSLPPLRNNPNKFPKGNIPKGDESEWYFHRGHILARQFHKYVLGNKILDYKYKNTKRIWTDLCIDSKKNLFTQFSSANQIQADIEKEVFNLLQSDKEVYYEVKAVYKNYSDTYPIGTEIFYLSISSPEIFEHYFIPNTDLDFDLSTLHEEGSKLSYSDFYKNGYREEYRKYFKNSDRDEYEIAENIIIDSNDFYLDFKNKFICPVKQVESEIIRKALESPSKNISRIFSRKEIDDVENLLRIIKAVKPRGENHNIVYPVSPDRKVYIDWDIAKERQSGKQGFEPGQKALEAAFKYMNWL
ncbi:hypothetical protein C6A27_05825 [Streptococcus anginosus]|uniref:DNA/RNA non-specific endonuclease domain-containing protein n=1 Tax=Streptococcus anginosus TaxID=1328 RepID=A0A2T0G3A8_STRAP|nr:hypothetical protein [Streptococcus anginosus]PRT70553.1 hypothetical protein C6A27_05825 [Streptococcus anginosus]